MIDQAMSDKHKHTSFQMMISNLQQAVLSILTIHPWFLP